MSKKTPKSDPCPCGMAAPYAACCGRFHLGAAVETAEQLMRSRYCAFVLGNEDYLLASWAASTRPEALDLHEDPVKWLGLQIVTTEAGGAGDEQGVVEFVARYKLGGRAGRLHERSRFVREEGAWRYLDGDIDSN